MELHQLTKHCYWSDPVSYGDRPGLGLIAGVEATLAVDTGNGPGHGLWLLREAESLGLPPVRWAALTHWHWDHIMGGRAMQEAGVSLICTRGTGEQLRVLSEYQWTHEAIARRVEEGLEIPFCQKGIREEYPDEPRALDPPLPDLEIQGPVTIDLEGVTVRLLPQPSDHSPDGLLVHCPEDKVPALPGRTPQPGGGLVLPFPYGKAPDRGGVPPVLPGSAAPLLGGGGGYDHGGAPGPPGRKAGPGTRRGGEKGPNPPCEWQSDAGQAGHGRAVLAMSREEKDRRKKG